jgi:hypothetical protein
VTPDAAHFVTPAVVAGFGRAGAYRRRMPTDHPCSPDRLLHLRLVAAARASAVQPTDPQQIADIVRVTVDDEVDTTTFAAIVSDVAADVLP